MKTIKQSVFRELSNKFSGNEFTKRHPKSRLECSRI